MNRTKVDWWAWRSKGKPEAVVGALQAAVADTRHSVTLAMRKGGWMGYEQSAEVRVGDMQAGLMAWGGDRQRGWTFASLSGEGCGWVSDWDRAQEAAEAAGPGYEARRVDVALDVFDGSSSFDATLAAYRAGGFSPAGSGRPPKCEPMKPERAQDSAIIKIGSRESDKYLRGYEKGKQLLGPSITASMQRDPEAFDWADWVGARVPMVDGGELRSVPMWDWWRLELELKPQSGPLPEDLIDRRDQYFAGAYPYLGQVVRDVDPEALVIRRERGPRLDLAAALECVRRQWGSTLFTALVAHHGDIGAVWERIVGAKHNNRLVRAGVLMVDHD